MTVVGVEGTNKYEFCGLKRRYTNKAENVEKDG